MAPLLSNEKRSPEASRGVLNLHALQAPSHRGGFSAVTQLAVSSSHQFIGWFSSLLSVLSERAVSKQDKSFSKKASGQSCCLKCVFYSQLQEPVFFNYCLFFKSFYFGASAWKCADARGALSWGGQLKYNKSVSRSIFRGRSHEPTSSTGLAPCCDTCVSN